jgi:hypothetical protein
MACPNVRGGCRTDLGALVWCRALASFAMRTRAPIAITANFAFMMTSCWHAVRMPAPAHSCTMTIRRHGILGLPPAAMKGCSPRPKPSPPPTGDRFLGNARRRGDTAPADRCVNLPHASNRFRWRPVFEQVLPWRSLSSAAEIDPIPSLTEASSCKANKYHFCATS